MGRIVSSESPTPITSESNCLEMVFEEGRRLNEVTGWFLIRRTGVPRRREEDTDVERGGRVRMQGGDRVHRPRRGLRRSQPCKSCPGP